MKRKSRSIWISAGVALFAASLAVSSAVCAEPKASEVNGAALNEWSEWSGAGNADSGTPEGDRPHPAGKGPHPEGRDHDAGRMHGGGLFHDAAEILGMQTEALKAELQQGKSLADVAKAKGISESELVAKLTVKANSRIDQGVKSGRITREKATEIKKQLAVKLPAAVSLKGLPNYGKHHGAWMAKRWSRVAAIIGISEDELARELKAGKSVAEIAQAHGVSRDKLIQQLKEGMTSDLEKFIDHKRTDSQSEGRD